MKQWSREWRNILKPYEEEKEKKSAVELAVFPELTEKYSSLTKELAYFQKAFTSNAVERADYGIFLDQQNSWKRWQYLEPDLQ